MPCRFCVNIVKFIAQYTFPCVQQRLSLLYHNIVCIRFFLKETDLPSQYRPVLYYSCSNVLDQNDNDDEQKIKFVKIFIWILRATYDLDIMQRKKWWWCVCLSKIFVNPFLTRYTWAVASILKPLGGGGRFLHHNGHTREHP